ncbi:uncharacterized protein HD556DRAFT_1320650 [Suillus plorans]|uniref:Uncharacterized protein n=1 Tax=Suillus plorans TaxID=116603 RepID=A0A9P7E3U6_9AGAM|nr:uncharacterized protein HD556DRAFT_1320650 [Suillus plorans]KAG1810460.1 hypothetical protein HD556DRAFT_1320650 [Suillus plorans]
MHLARQSCIVLLLPLIRSSICSVKCCLTASSLNLTLSTTQAPTMALILSEASFRLGQAPLTPRQVLPNIFAVSVLISTFTLLCRVKAYYQCRVKPRQCRVTASSNLVTASSNLVTASSTLVTPASNLVTPASISHGP